MSFFSTHDAAIRGSLLDTTLTPVPAGGGLWLPDGLEAFPAEFFATMHEKTRDEIAEQVCARILCNELPKEVVKQIVAKMPRAPLVNLDKSTAVLELFHGDTMAFKDFGAGFMAQATSYLLSTEEGRKACTRPRVLVATSGDTGGAVAKAFAGTTTPVCVLFPGGRISEFQKGQICRCGPGVAAIQIDGVFDDCQRIAKAGLNTVKDTLSANSINMLRLVAQAVYYFDALRQLGPLSSHPKPLTVVVPSGNMGNGTAGVLAMRMGLPIDRLVLATNANDSVPRLIATGEWKPKASVATISSAMDVGDPSNFARLWSLSGASAEQMRVLVGSESVTEDETYAAMRSLHIKYGYVADPHTSVAYAVLERSRAGAAEGEGMGIILSTAHPYKFDDIVSQGLGGGVEVPKPANLVDWSFPPCTLRLVGEHAAFVKMLDATRVIVGGASVADRKEIAEILQKEHHYGVGGEGGSVVETWEHDECDKAVAAAGEGAVVVWIARGGGGELGAKGSYLLVDDAEVTNAAVGWAIAALLPAVKA